MKMSRLFKIFKTIIFCTVFVTVFNRYSAAQNYLPMGDYSYKILDRLEAEGVIKSGLLDSRPISIDDAIRLYNEASLNSA